MRRYQRRTQDKAGKRIGEKPLACPYCKALQSSVLPMRPKLQEADAYVRERKCSNCRGIFFTDERVRAAS